MLISCTSESTARYQECLLDILLRPSIINMMAVALLFVIWFVACVTLWAQIFPMEDVYSLALALTWLNIVPLTSRLSCPTSPHSLQDKHRRHQHGDDG